MGKSSGASNCGRAMPYVQTDAGVIEEMCWDSPSQSRDKLGVYSNQDGSYLRVLEAGREEGIDAEVWLRADPFTIAEDIRDSARVAMKVSGNDFRPRVIEAQPLPKGKRKRGR